MMQIDKNTKYIIRADRAGVFFGNVEDYSPETGVVTMTNCRRVWYWDGAASLSQLATEGTNNKRECKFTVTVAQMMIAGVIEIIPCTDAAVKSINGVSEWKR